jgi:ADP-ribose pyrophosphatase YjhB (NUDIX family)
MMYRLAASFLSLVEVASAFASQRSHHFSKKGVIIRPAYRFRRINTSLSADRYCEMCGTPTQLRIPEGDERERHVCGDPNCGHIAYHNPKVVVGAICTYNDQVLLCKRAIEPCSGKWGYPQGFLELGETTRQGAARETWEEAGVRFDSTKADLLAVYNLAGMQIQMIYRAKLDNDKFEAGHESSDVKFVAWDDIPWDELAFQTVTWGLEYARDVKDEVSPAVQERTKLMTMDGKWKVAEG